MQYEESVYAITAGREYMFNGRKYYPFECGDGWRDLLIELCAELARLDVDQVIRVSQVKEKKGTLRFYFTMRVPNEALWIEAERAIGEAEVKSACTCEECGQPGARFTISKWDMVRCDRHRKIEEDRRGAVAKKQSEAPRVVLWKTNGRLI
jgi:hypothetical protein